jgi:hydrogenase maturation protease
MNTTQVDPIVNALLYEGYLLYPYRTSSKKNSRQRFTFGRIYPRAYSESQGGAEPWVMQTECLLCVRSAAPELEVTVRFLQPLCRRIGLLPVPYDKLPPDGDSRYKLVPELRLDGKLYQTCHEAIERTVSATPLSLAPNQPNSRTHDFSFPSALTREPIQDAQGRVSAVLLRSHESLNGRVEIEAKPWDCQTFKITVRISNLSEVPATLLSDDQEVLARLFASTHTILQATGGEFISLMETPAQFQQAALVCLNLGTWPVLVGGEKIGRSDTLLSSPIILYDYPRIPPESPGDFFDCTEIDEMLALRVMTLTDEEKIEPARSSPNIRGS